MPTKLDKPRVLAVLAGEDFPLDRLDLWLRTADVVIAADGAANALNQLGRVAAITVGDLDSISDESRSRQKELVQIDDQNSTDCDKLLDLALQRGYSSLSLIGVEGDLLDHTLGTLRSVGLSCLNIRIILRRGVAYVLRGPIEKHLLLPESTRLSLMPLTPCVGVNLIGTQWPLSNAELSPLGANSLSNRALGPVSIQIQKGAAVVFLSHPELEVVKWDDDAEQLAK